MTSRGHRASTTSSCAPGKKRWKHRENATRCWPSWLRPRRLKTDERRMAAAPRSSRRILIGAQRSTRRVGKGVAIRTLVCPPERGCTFLYGRFSGCALGEKEQRKPRKAKQNPFGVAGELPGLAGHAGRGEHSGCGLPAGSAPGAGLAPKS